MLSKLRRGRYQNLAGYCKILRKNLGPALLLAGTLCKGLGTKDFNPFIG